MTADSVTLFLTTVISFLAAYRSFSVRRALASSLYRGRALWTGIVAFVVAAYGLLQIVGENSGFTASGFIPPNVPLWFLLTFSVGFSIGTIAIGLWIYSTVEVAVDLDFLHRDPLGWSRFKKPTLILIFVSSAIDTIAMNDLEFLASSILLGVFVVYSASVLAISWKRVHDSAMRSYLRWMGLLLAALGLELVTGAINFYFNFPLIVFSYFLFRAAGSLSKTKRMESEIQSGGTTKDLLQSERPSTSGRPKPFEHW